MDIFCTDTFYAEFHKIYKKNSYKDIESEIIKHFFDKSAEELCNGTLLNNKSEVNPYIKKRLKGSGGYRVYFYIYIVEGRTYLLFLHPKTGSMGSSNIDDAFKVKIIKTLSGAIKNNQIYKMSKDSIGKRIIFTRPIF